MSALYRRVEEDPPLPGQSATELDVLDRRLRVAGRVEPSGGVEGGAPHGPDAGPERLHVTGRALVDDVMEQVAERRHRAPGRDGVVVRPEDPDEALIARE